MNFINYPYLCKGLTVLFILFLKNSIRQKPFYLQPVFIKKNN
ncbi:hypothetical protein THERMOT_111 [Bathymodiolus thermophilus thioautotrophic gill symbiont]|uniref:Uncharacterized protein n=1 Tax=Bathymodiolus thermophilus thioautotrophic gill symbiont TaxID=2360 RepID=A0A8H8XBB5_9GAMM|nr:hypothetical protein THERMOS_22 [Bathymodiolus thermophilus thioautotrophic gill symbiont]CAB5494479.1 hypothetical protein THERMOT_111 [Bathymodiolus thermophilus thioautotrophic gill symbiont]